MPIYETDEDVARQERMIKRFCEHFSYDYAPFPPKHKVDYAILKPQRIKGHWYKVVAGMVEVKTRSFPHKKYPTMMVNVGKVLYAKQFVDIGIKVVLLVGWTDAVGFISLTADSFAAMGGRNDRGDPNDEDVMIHFPIEDFTMIAHR